MTPELQSYIDASRAHGMDDAAIRQALLGVGWTEAALKEAWPLTTPIPNQAAALDAVVKPANEAKPKRRPRVGRLVFLAVLLVLILGGGAVLAGELGYAPAISKFYRQTRLPLLWHGTTSDPGLNIGRAMLAAVQAPKVKVTLTGEGTITNVDPNAATNLGLAVPPAGTLADVVAPSTTTKGTAAVTYDASTGIHLLYGFDIPDSIRQMLEGYLKPDFKTITLESILTDSGDKAYFRSNILPIPTADDKDRWFTYDLPAKDGFTSARNSTEQSLNKDSSTVRNDLDIIAKATSKDQGIIQRNGQTVAWYHTVLSPALLQTISTNVALSSGARGWIKSILSDWKSGEVGIDWYMDARTPRLLELTIQANVVTSAATITEQDTVKVEYGSTAAVAVPTQVWESFESYFTAVKANQKSLYDTGALTQSAVDFLAGFADQMLGTTAETGLPGVIVQ